MIAMGDGMSVMSVMSLFDDTTAEPSNYQYNVQIHANESRILSDLWHLI